jgi:L-2-hydroxycarboxylate dehydrogenase (NAD+)
VNPKARITVVRESASTALIDGDTGLGQVIAYNAMEVAVKKPARLEFPL